MNPLDKEETVKSHVHKLTIVCITIAFLTASAQGVIIPLSTHSSEPEHKVPADWLDATMELTVAQEGDDWVLTLQVTNLTMDNPPDDCAFNMSELYFNTTADITGIELVDVQGGDIGYWGVALYMDSIPCDGFGYFDIALATGEDLIESQDTVTFKMHILGESAPYIDTDFFALSADGGAGHLNMYGAAKFKQGPHDLSAYGGYVPEPASIFLLGLGALALFRKRRG